MKEYICKEDIRNKLYDEDAITMRGVNIINNYPAADVREVVRGRWIWKDNGEVVCSECNDLIAIVGNTEDLITVKSYHNFCPNCGADMREEQT